MAQGSLSLDSRKTLNPMSKYSGKPYRVNKPRTLLFEGLSNLSQIRDRIDTMPADLQQRLGTVNFPDNETLAFTAPGVGEMKFRIVERTEPESVRFLADTGVVPIYVTIGLAEAAVDATDVTATIEAEIPMMLRPLIGGKLQEAADKFGEMFGQLNA